VSAEEFPAGSHPFLSASGDFNNDGNPDVLTIGNDVVVLPGNGDGTLGSPIVSPGSLSGS
jgi:hypothetical protein